MLLQMQSWIDQAKTKLLEIIEEAKTDVGDLNLRVGFVGCVIDGVGVALPLLFAGLRPDVARLDTHVVFFRLVNPQSHVGKMTCMSRL